MKTLLKILTVTLLAGWYNTCFAQYEWQKPPKPNEKVLGFVEGELSGGYYFFYTRYEDKQNGVWLHKPGDKVENLTTYPDDEFYKMLRSEAEGRYGDTYPSIELRDLRVVKKETNEKTDGANIYWIKYKASATVVIPNNKMSADSEYGEGNDLTKALDKALQDIREGSRIAIDQVKVPSGMDKNEYKDQIVEILLDKGYKVVAKEYLEKLYDEQQAQQSGKYNEKTKVKENNLSAVGYYLNVRLTETSLRVQIINVSTGEYDANVTIKLQQ